MKILSNKTFNTVSGIKNTSTPAIRYTIPCCGSGQIAAALKTQTSDCFIKSNKAEKNSKTITLPGIYDKTKIEAEYIKDVILKDAAGKDVRAFLAKSKDTNSTYYICLPQKILCGMSIYDIEDHIYIKALYGQKHDGKYKGAGTELLKFAAQESIRCGHNGKIKLCMGGSPVFYYKNNFRTENNGYEDVKKNAAMDYMARNNLTLNDFYLNGWCTNVVLNPKEAAALLDGKRLYKQSSSSTICNKNIGYKINGKEYFANVDIDFADLSNSESFKNTYVIQAILKSSGKMLQIADLKMRLLEDKEGKKFLSIDSIDLEKISKDCETKIKTELILAAKKKMEEFGAEYISTDISNIEGVRKICSIK